METRKVQDPGSKLKCELGATPLEEQENELRNKEGARETRAPLLYAKALASALAFFVCAAILEIEAQGELHDAGWFLAGQVGDLAEG